MRPLRHWSKDEQADQSASTNQAPPSESVYTPALDIHESPDGLIIEADLPGVPPDQLDVRVEDNVLYIHGKVRWPELDNGRALYEELRPGDFYRSFILSEQVETERITADFNQGVLRLSLPKAIKSRPRKIEVRTTSGQSSSSTNSSS